MGRVSTRTELGNLMRELEKTVKRPGSGHESRVWGFCGVLVYRFLAACERVFARRGLAEKDSLHGPRKGLGGTRVSIEYGSCVLVPCVSEVLVIPHEPGQI